ncbi:protein SFI1 homolog isoform X10 [Equus przewalskii]|uniref:Protein SFI1 homolog isoform X10 n=1 Tax=Equus przewalskii TaxID=9798 RepID=A0ABM4Q538_EQUPR
MERKFNSRSFRDGAVKKPYSPKILSNKKSSAVSVIRSEIPSPGHPVQYRASHAGTRRGRLRELRIRCVARKFLYLWIRKTFGRVFPSKARLYYEQRILQKVFEEWKEEWWVFHREWKLCVRADCHYRYYLYNLMFQTWKTYVHQQQEMRNKYMKAEDHDAKQKMRQAWKSWLIYVVFRRTKLQMQTTALEFRQRSVLWVRWREWRQRLGQVRLGRALHATAVKHRALRLQLQAWSQWQQQLLCVRRERRKVVSAVKHHQHWQKWRSLKAWLEYLQGRRMKRQWKEMAQQFHRVTVLHTHFCDWQWAWERRKSLYTHHTRVMGLARRMVLWRAFTHWKHYVLLCAEEAAQWKVAEEHHRCSLLHFCFRALKDNVTRAHLQRVRRNLAHQQRDVMLLHRFWNLWQSRIEQREEREQLPLLRAAWDHYRITLLCKCIKLWLQCTQKRQYKQLLQARADGHFQQRALPAAFQAWRRLWQQHQQKGVLNARAARFHRETLQKRVFAVWWQKMFQHREHRLAERMTYQSQVRSILQEVAVRESQHRRQLLRDVLRCWRENTMARVDETKKTSRASAHYRRTMCSKVLVQWREAASVQIYYRQQEDCAVREAQKVLERGCLRTWFQRWRDRGQRAAQWRVQLERAAQHDHQRLLLRGMARWKAHHLCCIRKRLLQRQGTRLRAQTLSRSCFRQWRQQLVNKRREQQGTARALWFWSFSLQAKVWAAWLGFLLERRRKKARLERAVQAYHQQLLQEGVTRLLRFAAGMRAFRQQLHAQQQVQAAHSLHRAVHRCAMLWKQKVLGWGREPRPPASTMPSKRVTLEGPLPNRIAVGPGDATLETKRLRTPHGPQGALGSMTLAAGDSQLLELNAARSARKQPRRPDFLLEPVQSQRPLGCGTFRGLGPEVLRERGLGVAQPAGPSMTRPFLAKAQTALVPGSPLPQPRALLSPPGLKLPPTASTGPELLPPSSFMPRGTEAPSSVSALPTTPGLMSRASPSPASVPDPCLLLPGDFTGTRHGPGFETAGVHLKPGSTVSTRPTPSTWAPCIQPGPSWKGGQDEAYSPVAMGHTDLEAELEGIQQQLQDYQTTKQNLWSYQRQARSLRRWLELSREEPRPEDEEAEQQVQEELQEVELQIQQLAAELQAQRQPISAGIARLQALRRALC